MLCNSTTENNGSSAHPLVYSEPQEFTHTQLAKVVIILEAL